MIVKLKYADKIRGTDEFKERYKNAFNNGDTIEYSYPARWYEILIHDPKEHEAYFKEKMTWAEAIADVERALVRYPKSYCGTIYRCKREEGKTTHSLVAWDCYLVNGRIRFVRTFK